MNSNIVNLTANMCLRMFARYLPIPPNSILDVGCGTGQALDALSRICPDCWGIDYLPEVVESAKTQKPHLQLYVRDMRSARLRRTFDVIICIGSGFMYAQSKEDVAKILETFAAHAHIGTLLILDVLNAAGLGKEEKIKNKIGYGLCSSPSSNVAILQRGTDRRRQTLVRQRVWNIDGKNSVKDCCRYRSFFPNEIKDLLIQKGFQVVGIFDNMELKDTDLSGLKLYMGSIKYKHSEN